VLRKKLGLLIGCGVALAAASVAVSAQAGAGLDASVYYNIPGTNYYPDDTSITQTQNYVAGATPDYTFVNTNDAFQYTNTSDMAHFLGDDAAGAAKTDTSSVYYVAVDQRGYVVIPTAGTYTFAFNYADDAARLTLGGTAVAEQDFYSGNLSLPSSYTADLSAGATPFDLFWFQQSGGANLSFQVTGPGAVSYETSLPGGVPEPATWAMLILGVAGLGVALRRRNSGAALAAA
jgi:hypothetical protein